MDSPAVIELSNLGLMPTAEEIDAAIRHEEMIVEVVQQRVALLKEMKAKTQEVTALRILESVVREAQQESQMPPEGSHEPR